MHSPFSRRQFLADVGKGTLLATIGPALATELGIAAPAAEGESPAALKFGDLEPLVALMQETPVAKLQPALVAKLKEGVPLKRLLAAGVLANARTFGGEDYVGFHTLMALSPALKMSADMPEKERALPVLKVLYRNTNRMQESGGCAHEVLRPVAPRGDKPTPAQLHDAVRRKDTAAAEAIFATMSAQSAGDGFNALLECVQDDTEVHRTVLPYRAWELLDVVGREHATTMLRQSLRYCLNAEKHRRAEWDEHSRVLARLLDEHKLLGRAPGARAMDDAALAEISGNIFRDSPEQAAGAVAAALAEGFDPQAVGEAISLAANQILLRDHGRPPEWEFDGKPTGSVHGDSVGVRAADAIHAWRNLSAASAGRNVFACLILAAWQAARDAKTREFVKWEPVPSKRQVDQIAAKEPEKLLADLEAMIRQRMQSHAGAIVHRYGMLGLPEKPVFDLMRRYAVSEDGALHAEKYFQTAWDEFHRTRPAFRWRHVVGLARVTASEFGRPAPGQAEARELLGV
jgi:hypothetical protein